MYPGNSENVCPEAAPGPTPPPPSPPQPQSRKFPEGKWSTGFCDCCSDPSSCCITCCCPCLIFGQVAEIIDRGNLTSGLAALTYYGMAHFGCGWLYACTYRYKLRGMFALPQAPCADWLVHLCCHVCSISQEYRELKIRGFDPSIGWQANAERWKREGLEPPFVASGMDR